VLYLYLVRHAHSDWTTDEQRPLSADGLANAERVPDIMKSYPISRIVSSPYRRALQTIEPMAHACGLPIHQDHRLAERKIGQHPNKDFNRVVRYLWLNPRFSFPGGESNTSAQQRGLAFIQSLLNYQQSIPKVTPHIIISTHGNLMTLILQHFYPAVDYKFWSQLSFPDIYRLPVTVSEHGQTTVLDGQKIYPDRLWVP
jgi:2,3-bisphosphoglycerate-dependent phosphoglycerate mutase